MPTLHTENNQAVKTFFRSELPLESVRGSTQLAVYRGVLVVFDDDVDATVLDWLDCLPCLIVENLLAVCPQENGHEYTIDLLWKKEVHPDFAEGCDTSDPSGNTWTIGFSNVAK